jgi:large subunit ribosomal protein L6
MSRVGIQPIAVPEGVTVSIADGRISAQGPKGEGAVSVPEFLTVSQEGQSVFVKRKNEAKRSRAMHGTIRSLMSNLVEGVHRGFERQLEIEGIGYRAALQGRELALSLGFSHVINFPIPDGIDVELKGQTSLTISGIDKQQVGLVAARIRAFSPAEPYKGKGVRYLGEQVRRKTGKAVS